MFPISSRNFKKERSFSKYKKQRPTFIYLNGIKKQRITCLSPYQENCIQIIWNLSKYLMDRISYAYSYIFSFHFIFILFYFQTETEFVVYCIMNYSMNRIVFLEYKISVIVFLFFSFSFLHFLLLEYIKKSFYEKLSNGIK